jgi:hypothetical protein
MAGRPKAEIDWKRVDQMLMAQCDGVSICATLGIDDNTLYRACMRDHKIGFGIYSQQKRARGVSHAKEVFYKQAWVDKDVDGQTTKQIFWLKNHAGMADKVEQKTEHSGEINTASRVEIVAVLPDNDRSSPPTQI